MPREFHQPNAQKLHEFLQKYPRRHGSLAAALAWLAGLRRAEIEALTWEQIDLENAVLSAAGRTVPLDAELAGMLALSRRESGRMLVSARSGEPYRTQELSRILRRTLDAAEQQGVTFADLRLDFIRRQLTEHDLSYVLRVSGLTLAAYRGTVAPLFGAPAAPEEPEAGGETDEYLLWRILQTRRGTDAGLALWLAWYPRLSAREIAALTWDAVDLRAGVIRLPDREVPLTKAVSGVLAEARARHGEGAYVIASPSGAPVSAQRLSVMLRELLIRGGIEHKTLRTLLADASRRQDEERLLALARRRGSVTLRAAADELGAPKNSALVHLRALCARGALVHISSGYYPAGQAVPPEEQERLVLDYVRTMERVYLSDIARLLHLESRAARTVLARMVREGKLQLDRGRKHYLLPVSGQ